jgi:hypothetical protein
MENVIIEHRHIKNGDSVYTYSEGFFDSDKIKYEEYMKNNFDDLIQRIKQKIQPKDEL